MSYKFGYKQYWSHWVVSSEVNAINGAYRDIIYIHKDGATFKIYEEMPANRMPYLSIQCFYGGRVFDKHIDGCFTDHSIKMQCAKVLTEARVELHMAKVKLLLAEDPSCDPITYGRDFGDLTAEGKTSAMKKDCKTIPSHKPYGVTWIEKRTEQAEHNFSEIIYINRMGITFTVYKSILDDSALSAAWKEYSEIACIFKGRIYKESYDEYLSKTQIVKRGNAFLRKIIDQTCKE